MPDTTDTSTAFERHRFCNAIEGGPAVHLQAAAEAVACCTARLPETTSALLGLHDGATYAQAVAQLRCRWSDGRAGH